LIKMKSKMKTMRESVTLKDLGIKIISGAIIALSIISCQKKQVIKDLTDADILHNNQDQLTQIIIYDVFSPPVASRLYVYASLASYEAIRFSKEGAPSLTEKLKDFGPMPQPEGKKEYNYCLAASKSFFNVVHNVKVFSVDSLKKYEESLLTDLKRSWMIPCINALLHSVIRLPG